MKELSCGILVICGRGLLIGHCTNCGDHWNIPKGHIEEGETPIQCAIRETFEETNLKFTENELIDLGQFEYLKNKDLHLFGTKIPFEPDNIKCNSLFIDKYGEEIFEFDDFLFVPITELRDFFYPNLYNSVFRALKKWSENENN